MCQTSSINEQTLQFIEQEQQKAVEQAKANLATATHTQTLAARGKDIVLPAPKEDGKKYTSGKLNDESPVLPPPKKGWDGVQDNEQAGLIAIVGSVLALMAKTNSNFWSTMWKQATKSMLAQVKFAPIIGQAVKDSAAEQADATRSQASKSLFEGISGSCSFVTAVGMGSVMEFKDPTETPPNEKLTADTFETNDPLKADENADTNGAGTRTQTTNQAENTDTADAQNTQNQQDAQIRGKANEALKKGEGGKNQSRASRLKDSVSKGGSRGMKRFSQYAGKIVQVSMMTTSMSQGMNGIAGSQYERQQAKHQGEAGVFDAISKECESYAQFYGQSFSRADGIRQGAQQAIDYAMNILKSAADTITQGVMSMFRG